MALPSPPARSQQRPPGAAKKHQRADHGENAQNEPHDRRRAGPGPEFFEQISGDQRPQDEPDDLGPHILHHGGPMQPQCARDVAIEAGHTNPHVGRVAPFLQQRCENPDNHTDTDDPPTGCQNVFDRCHSHPPQSKWYFGSLNPDCLFK